MSNKTDLDWMARNVHVWREGANYVCVNHTDGGYVFHEHNRNCAIWFTKDQWLSRRAELQNKPSWDDFGESAKFMAQDSDGAWMAFESEPAANYHVWSSMRGWCGYAREGRDRCRGEVLGDWRDTLEKRPERDEFEPFVSIEDSQEKEMKQDNKWFERGELPPVGEVCEAYIDYPPLWIETEIVAHKDGFAIGWCNSVMKGCHGDKAHEFRPLRSEREKAIDEMMEHCDYLGSRVFAGKLFDAGYRKEVK